MQGPKHSNHPLILSQATSSQLDWKWSSQIGTHVGWWHQSQWLFTTWKPSIFFSIGALLHSHLERSKWPAAFQDFRAGWEVSGNSEDTHRYPYGRELVNWATVPGPQLTFSLFFFCSNSPWVLTLLGFQHVVHLLYGEYKSMLFGFDHECWGSFIKNVKSEI